MANEQTQFAQFLWLQVNKLTNGLMMMMMMRVKMFLPNEPIVLGAKFRFKLVGLSLFWLFCTWWCEASRHCNLAPFLACQKTKFYTQKRLFCSLNCKYQVPSSKFQVVTCKFQVASCNTTNPISYFFFFLFFFFLSRSVSHCIAIPNMSISLLAQIQTLFRVSEFIWLFVCLFVCVDKVIWTSLIFNEVSSRLGRFFCLQAATFRCCCCF